MRKSWIVLGLFSVGMACTASAPAEQAPAEQAPAEQAPAEQAPAEQAARPTVESAPRGEVAAATRLTRITDADQVCMVNNQFMGRDQIPILFEGRTYYGCCANCVSRIQTDPTVRTALDPISGQSVDKSTAIMGQDGEGNVVYFENEQTFSRYLDQT